MANTNCEACEELRQVDPGFVVNGFDEENCASLQNDTGLSADSGHDDATDLNAMNDCLIGNMETEIEVYEVCDWKEFMKQLIPNMWTVMAAVICAFKGLWTNVHNLWSKMAEVLQSIANINQSITNLNNSISTINTNISNINSTVVRMPKDITYAEVTKRATIVPGFDTDHNTIDISAARSDGYVPKGVIGWDISEEGASHMHPFEVKLRGTNVRFQVRSDLSHNQAVKFTATVLYVKV